MRQTGDQHFDDYDHDHFDNYDHDDVGDFYDDHGDFDDFDFCFSHNGCDNCADGNHFNVL